MSVEFKAIEERQTRAGVREILRAFVTDAALVSNPEYDSDDGRNTGVCPVLAFRPARPFDGYNRLGYRRCAEVVRETAATFPFPNKLFWPVSWVSLKRTSNCLRRTLRKPYVDEAQIRLIAYIYDMPSTPRRDSYSQLVR